MAVIDKLAGEIEEFGNDLDRAADGYRNRVGKEDRIEEFLQELLQLRIRRGQLDLIPLKIVDVDVERMPAAELVRLALDGPLLDPGQLDRLIDAALVEAFRVDPEARIIVRGLEPERALRFDRHAAQI